MLGRSGMFLITPANPNRLLQVPGPPLRPVILSEQRCYHSSRADEGGMWAIRAWIQSGQDAWAGFSVVRKDKDLNRSHSHQEFIAAPMGLTSRGTSQEGGVRLPHLPQLVWGLPLELTSGPETIFLLFYTWVALSAVYGLGKRSTFSLPLRRGLTK